MVRNKEVLRGPSNCFTARGGFDVRIGTPVLDCNIFTKVDLERLDDMICIEYGVILHMSREQHTHNRYTNHRFLSYQIQATTDYSQISEYTTGELSVFSTPG